MGTASKLTCRETAGGKALYPGGFGASSGERELRAMVGEGGYGKPQCGLVWGVDQLFVSSS